MTRAQQAEAFLALLHERADELSLVQLDLVDAPDLDSFASRARDALDQARTLVAQLEDLYGDTTAGLGALEEP